MYYAIKWYMKQRDGSKTAMLEIFTTKKARQQYWQNHFKGETVGAFIDYDGYLLTEIDFNNVSVQFH